MSALVAMLALPGVRIFDAARADIAGLGQERGHRVLRVCGKGTKVVLVPPPPAAGRAIDRATASGSAGRFWLIPGAPGWAGTRPPAAWPRAPASRVARARPHMLRRTCVTTMLDAGGDVREVPIAARRAGPATTMRWDRARQILDRHPDSILAASLACGS
jgi:integrase